MKKITLLYFTIIAFAFTSQINAQSIVIGTGTSETTSTGSDPIDGYFNSFRYQVVYTAAELSVMMTPYDEITALGWSISGDYGGGALLGYTIKMGHTSAVNSATHDASPTTVVKNAFDYDPTVTAAGVFDMITFDTNFVWNGVDNILVEVCSDGQNAYTSPYGQVRTTTTTNGSRRFRTDGGTSCEVNTGTANADKPNIQFNYIDGTPPTDTLDYYNLQWPPNGSIEVGNTFDVYAQAYEAGLTDVTSGQAPGIQAWIGYSTDNTDPSGSGWTWIAATYLGEVGNNDEYTLDLGELIPLPGTYYYASRWSLNTAPFTYGGIQANGSFGGIWGADNNISGVLTVNNLPNDDCSGAIALTPGNNYAENAVDGTVVGATFNGETSSCQIAGPGPGVWYSVVVPADGNLTIETGPDSATNTTTFDSVIEVFSGDCGSLTSIDCDDDGASTGLYSILNLSGLTAGSTIYVRVWEYDGDELEPFSISAHSATLSVGDVENQNGFTYFPNPVKNTLNLKAQSNIQNLSIYNILGQEVLRTSPNALNSEVNMASLQTGAYFVKVTINDATETIRVIKQ